MEATGTGSGEWGKRKNVLTTLLSFLLHLGVGSDRRYLKISFGNGGMMRLLFVSLLHQVAAVGKHPNPIIGVRQLYEIFGFVVLCSGVRLPRLIHTPFWGWLL